jgi:hypothetical protein
MKKLQIAILAISLTAAMSASADLLVDRGLPTATAVGGVLPNSSSIGWADWETSASPSPYALQGDSFTIGGSGSYTVTDIRVWTAPSPYLPLPAVSLLGGVDGSTIGLTPINTSYTVTSSGFSDTGGAGEAVPLYQLDFAVNLTLTAGQTYDFFLNGPFTQWTTADTSDFYSPWLQYSTGQSGGGADGLQLLLNVASDGSTSVGTWNTGTGAGTEGYPAGWDAASDANVQVFGTPVPEPTTMIAGALLLLPFGASTLRILRKNRAA